MSEGTPFEARLSEAHAACDRLKAAIGQVIVGQDRVVEEVTWALLAGGHVLLEGAPGLGKTLLVRTLSECLDLQFSRVQFTPDLMPSDITGTNVLVMGGEQAGGAGGGSGRFALHKGPVFTQVLLADEINRATPKTQSALLEAMQEHAVTISGTRHALPQPFFVLGTENPIEMEGTYPLPEAQLDRFLLKVIVPSPSEDEMVTILSRTTGRNADGAPRVLSLDQVMDLRGLCRDVVVEEPVLRYASRVVKASSADDKDAPDLVKRGVRYGAGVRGAQSLVLAAKARALLEGRPHVSFSDIQRVALPVLRHRIVRSYEGEADGITTDAVVAQLVASIPSLPGNVARVVKGG